VEMIRRALLRFRPDHPTGATIAERARAIHPGALLPLYLSASLACASQEASSDEPPTQPTIAGVHCKRYISEMLAGRSADGRALVVLDVTFTPTKEQTTVPQWSPYRSPYAIVQVVERATWEVPSSGTILFDYWIDYDYFPPLPEGRSRLVAFVIPNAHGDLLLSEFRICLP
jgi:hypothetical protein